MAFPRGCKAMFEDSGKEGAAAGSPQQEALLLGLLRGQRKGCGGLEGIAHAAQQVVAVPGA